MERFNALRILLGLLALFTLTGCRSGLQQIESLADHPPQNVTVSVTPLTTMTAGETAQLKVEWSGGTAPCTISIDADTAQRVPAGTAAGESPYTWGFSLAEGTAFDWDVTLVDARGRSARSQGSYGPVAALPGTEPELPPTPDDEPDPVVEPEPEPDDPAPPAPGPVGPPVPAPIPTPNPLPLQLKIKSTHFTYPAGILDVKIGVKDGCTPLEDYSEYYIAMTWIRGLIMEYDNRYCDAEGNWQSRWRTYGTPDRISEITWITIRKNHREDLCEPVFQLITCGPYPEVIPKLGIVPSTNEARVGETVTITIEAVNGFPCYAPLCYMNGVAVTVEEGGDYVAGTFNVGSVGHDRKYPDGIWAKLAPLPNGYFLPEDFMMCAKSVYDQPGVNFLGFNVTPLGAGDTTESGALFNFGMAFDHPGVYHLGFLEFQNVKLTYYSDNLANEYKWLEGHHGLQDLGNVITVVE